MITRPIARPIDRPIDRRRLFALFSGALAATCLAGTAQALSFVERLGKHSVTAEMARDLGWPEGATVVANQPTRAEGWHPFFSECPNDVYHYGYRLQNAAETNRLLSAIDEVPGARVFLLADKEYRQNARDPQAYQAHFALGSQSVLNEWWQQLPDGRLGVHVYPQPPTAVPPTLSLYLGEAKINPDQLVMPRKAVVATASPADLRKQGASNELAEALQRAAKRARRGDGG